MPLFSIPESPNPWENGNWHIYSQDFKADIKAQKNKKKAAAAAAAAAKKQASTEDASKDTKRSSYKEYLKKMIGNESDNSDDGVPLWEQSDEEEEDYEEAIRNARSRGLWAWGFARLGSFLQPTSFSGWLTGGLGMDSLAWVYKALAFGSANYLGVGFLPLGPKFSIPA